VKSIFRYPGGKSKKSIQQLVLSYIPAGTEEYREAFCGGAGIFFGLDEKLVKLRWVNDINHNLMSVYLALRDRPEEFIKKCREILPPQIGEEEVSTKTEEGKKYNARLGKIFNSFKYNEEMDQALRYFFINRTVWGGRVNCDKKFESRLYYSNPNGWNIIKTDLLEQASKKLQNVKITSYDYETLLKEDGQNVWIYLDPPYLVNSEFDKGSKLYQYNFDEADHLRFINVCKNTKHKLCISYDDNEQIREWFKDFYIFSHEWKYSGSSKKEKSIGKELIITNYAKPT